MVQVKGLFARRRTIVISIATALAVLAIAGVVVAIVLGISGGTAHTSNRELCGAAHETYVINGSSILGKYSRAAVAVDNEECSNIGRDILRRNGSTIDAALAAAICNGVMNGHSMGIGGGCIITIYSKTKNQTRSLIGREKAPAAANATMFVGRANSSTTGGLAIGVPGEIRAYEYAHRNYGGKLPWRDLFQPTIDLCKNGFNISASQAAAIRQSKRFILADPGLRAAFVKNNETDELYGEGDIVKRPNLAATLEAIADEGADAFYNGSLTKTIVQEIRDNGGIITENDLHDYHLDEQEAIEVQLNDSFVAYTTQAPSSGPILAFILNIMQGYNFASNDLNSTEKSGLFYHRLIEAFKFAYAKRSELGDPKKINITELLANLTSKDYADSIRSKINDDQTYDFRYYGGAWLDQIKVGTAHISVVGPDGDAVALTSTINLYFGSKVMGTKTGIIYNNEMDDFSTPNTTNSFGVPASPANFIEPGKRPMSSMAPLIVLDKNTQRIRQVLGASGGTRITTSIAQVSMLNLLFNRDIRAAIESPRLHSQLLPDEVIAESGFDGNILRLLRQRGHNITCGAFGGSVIQGIEWNNEAKQYWANCDIRKGGAPAGFDCTDCTH